MFEKPVEIENLFESKVRVFSAAIEPRAWHTLFPGERALVERAVEKRKNEFATGRMLARHVLARFGLVASELLQDRNQVPTWPLGVSGSISHCDTRAVVAVGRRDDVGTIGVDVEVHRELAEELWSTVLIPEELQQLQRRPAQERGRIAMTLFSAKESFYKAQYPRTGTFMDFSDVRIELADAEEETAAAFTCVFQKPVGSFSAGAAVPGRFRLLGALDIVVTAVSITDRQVR